MNCRLFRIGDSLACHQCGRPYKSKAEPHKARRQCIIADNRPSAPPGPPPLSMRLANFSKAAIAHAVAGNPTCTQEQIDERLAICRGCEMFRKESTREDMGVCAHQSCGCQLSREQKYLNKLAWADQSCPLEKWGAVSSS